METLKSVTDPKLLAVAANRGDEIIEIIGDFSPLSVTVVDLSKQAIAQGRSKFQEFSYGIGNMEDLPVGSKEYDVYLNLRSIHSRGVELKSALSEARRVLRRGGLCVISVSNGYIRNDDGKSVVELGMYDSRLKGISRVMPDELVMKIKEKMISYGFENVRYEECETEIFIFGKKG